MFLNAKYQNIGRLRVSKIKHRTKEALLHLHFNYVQSEIALSRKKNPRDLQFYVSLLVAQQLSLCFTVCVDRKERESDEPGDHFAAGPSLLERRPAFSRRLLSIVNRLSPATLPRWKSALEAKGRNFQIAIPPGHSPLFTGCCFSLVAAVALIHFPSYGGGRSRRHEKAVGTFRAETGETNTYHESSLACVSRNTFFPLYFPVWSRRHDANEHVLVFLFFSQS